MGIFGGYEIAVGDTLVLILGLLLVFVAFL